MDFNKLVLILSLFAPKNRGLVKALKWLQASLDEDGKLKELAPGAQTILEIPDDLDPKLKSRGGKRFAIDGVVVKRLKEDSD